MSGLENGAWSVQRELQGTVLVIDDSGSMRSAGKNDAMKDVTSALADRVPGPCASPPARLRAAHVFRVEAAYVFRVEAAHAFRVAKVSPPLRA